MRRASHWRNIEDSEHLQKVLGILQDADGPMSGLELQDEAMRRGFRIVNAGTDCWEIGKNDGYEMSGGVRFPDKKYRYWLIRAKRWSPRWRVTKDLRVVPVHFIEQEIKQPEKVESVIPESLFCSNPSCRKPIVRDPADPMRMTCDDACNAAWRESLRPKKEGVLF